MDKLTAYDILAFLIPGSFFNGLLFYLSIIYDANITAYIPDGYIVIYAIIFFGLSYIMGFMLSELAYAMFKFLGMGERLKNSIDHAQIIIDSFDFEFIQRLNIHNERMFLFSFIDNEKNVQKSNLMDAFYLWIETISMQTKYGLTTVLHGQYMMFRNIFMASIIFILITLITIIIKRDILFTCSFKALLPLVIIFLPLSYHIYVNRVIIYTKVATRAIYIYFLNKTNTDNNED